MTRHDLDSLRGQAAAVRAGAVTPEDLVRRALARIAETDGDLHAWTVVDGDRALAEARSIAARLAAGETPGPLAGTPVGIKDIIDVEGLPTRCGSAVHAHAGPATADADVVSRLRAAGAIVIGKTVTQEFAAGVLSPPAPAPAGPGSAAPAGPDPPPAMG
ncbi:MAG: amidase family protein, partial [Chloroflexota bacterium]